MNESVQCLAPFTNIFYKGWNNKVKPCCEGSNELEFVVEKGASWEDVWNHASYQELRASMLEGKVHAYCTGCLDKEKLGIFNARENYRNKIQKSLDNLSLSVDGGNQKNAPFNLDYRPNNICNLKCRMCNPTNSNLFAKEAKGSGMANRFDFPSESKLNDYSKESGEDLFIDYIPKENLLNIKLLGGEPTLSTDVFRFLQEVDGKNISLAITTNGTVLPKRIYSTFSKFKKVKLNISIDGINEYYDYIRTPSLWSEISANLVWICENSKHLNISSLSINCVLQMYNVFGIKDYLKYFMDFIKEQKENIDISLFINRVNQDWLSFYLLDDNDLSHVVNAVKELRSSYLDISEQELIEKVITLLESPHEKLVSSNKIFIDYTNSLDQLRNTKLEEINEKYKRYL